MTIIEGSIANLRSGARISGVTIVRGPADGVRVYPGEDPEIRDATVCGHASNGILCADDSWPLLSGVTIWGNRGPGLFCHYSSPEVADCVIAGNRTGVGIPGIGVVLIGSSAHLERCEISRNRGSGFYCEGSTPTFATCAIRGNWGAYGGGGVDCRNSSPVFTDCSIVENFATYSGGVSSDGEGVAAFDHCSIIGNCAEAGASGIASSSRVSLRSCIVWGNTGGTVSCPDVTATYSAIDLPGEGNLQRDPLLVGWGGRPEIFVDSSSPGPGDGSPANPFSSLAAALGSFSCALAQGSPCIGTGENGTNMGASTGIGGAAHSATVLIRVGHGTYDLRERHVARGVSIMGSGAAYSTLVGTVWGLATGCFLADLTVTGGTSGGIVVGFGEAPEVRRAATPTATGGSTSPMRSTRSRTSSPAAPRRRASTPPTPTTTAA